MSERSATQLCLQFRVTAGPTAAAADIHSHGERVMQELLSLEQCNTDLTDSTVSTDAAQKTITVELLILGERDPAAVLARALDVVRTAIHAAGVATPNWPGVSERPEQVRMASSTELMSST